MKLVVLKKYLGGQILYRSLVPPIKNGVKFEFFVRFRQFRVQFGARHRDRMGVFDDSNFCPLADVSVLNKVNFRRANFDDFFFDNFNKVRLWSQLTLRFPIVEFKIEIQNQKKFFC